MERSLEHLEVVGVIGAEGAEVAKRQPIDAGKVEREDRLDGGGRLCDRGRVRIALERRFGISLLPVGYRLVTETDEERDAS